MWGADITYIRMKHGWLYLVVIMDWVSRYILSWELSIILEVDFCIRALDKVLTIAVAEIFNSDQGCQFTSVAFLKCLEERNIQISMDAQKEGPWIMSLVRGSLASVSFILPISFCSVCFVFIVTLVQS